ncbi:MAG: hypothetical protein EHM35_18700, partial [Planctomycetaceae bacterium]
MVCTKRRVSSAVIVLAAAVISAVLGWLLYRPPALYRVTILPSLGGHFTRACSLNDQGEVVGVEDMGNDHHRVFLWDREHGMQDLGSSTGGQVTINNAGQVSGTM